MAGFHTYGLGSLGATLPPGSGLDQLQQQQGMLENSSELASLMSSIYGQSQNQSALWQSTLTSNTSQQQMIANIKAQNGSVQQLAGRPKPSTPRVRRSISIALPGSIVLRLWPTLCFARLATTITPPSEPSSKPDPSPDSAIARTPIDGSTT